MSSKTKSLLKGFVVIALLLCGAQTHAQTNEYQETLSDWAATLEQYVDDEGRTDFIKLAEDTSQLERFVAAVAKISPTSHPAYFPQREDVLAYHVNAYNALAMIGIIERGIPEDLNSFLKRASFFKFRSVSIGGEKTNLYDYENSVIRPLDEARMHFVLNCMVVDCPRLPKNVFIAETLEDDLQAASLEFFKNPKYVKIDDAKKVVYLSSIMKFYTKDYVASGKKQDLLPYVNQFREIKIPSDYKVKYLDYDWTVNQQP